MASSFAKIKNKKSNKQDIKLLPITINLTFSNFENVGYEEMSCVYSRVEDLTPLK